MSATDTSEKGLETLIMRHLTGTDGSVFADEGVVAETPDALAAAQAAGSGWLAGHPKDYDRTHALDVPQLFSFLHATQPDTLKKLGIGDYRDAKDINRQKFLARLSNEIGSYYQLVKKIEGDPEFDTKRAQKKLRRYVESHDHAIHLKAQIMVDHSTSK